ncbi:nucleoside-diphosphate kinase [Lentzea sp. NPDC102401]|uniref:nucleoside-diphosphate kinase n=1 Tax=Lentzea sp. NPDC102401 TaxID=3364128 RepID=UPI00382AAC1B
MSYSAFFHGPAGLAGSGHALVKPDGVRRGLSGTVHSRLLDDGLEVQRVGTLWLTTDIAARWYPDKLDEADGPLTLEYLVSGPMLLLAVLGEDALRRTGAVKRAIRAEFATDERHNVMHCPETVGERDHERAVFVTALRRRTGWTPWKASTP